MKKSLKQVLVLAYIVFMACIISKIVIVANSSVTNTLQFEWPMLGRDGLHQRFSDGPAPNKPGVLWSFYLGAGTGFAFDRTPTAFNGKLFAIGGGGTRLYAFDPLTGNVLWNITLSYPSNHVTKLDDNHFFVDDTRGIAVYRTIDGAFISRMDLYIGGVVAGNPGTGEYFPGRYDAQLKMKYRPIYNTTSLESWIIAINLTVPSTPKIAWRYLCNEPSALLGVADGKVFVGTTQGSVYALDARTGTLLWKAPKIGMVTTYSATYYEGKLYVATGNTRLTCYDATSGEVIWDKDQGPRAFFAFGGAAAYGRIYIHNINPWGGFVGCWDAETGDLLWKTDAHYYIGYYCPAVADGKVYITISDGTPVAGVTPPPAEFACLDAYTGSKLWSLYGVTATHPIIAYGRLFIISANTLYCIGDKPPTNWTYFRGNIDSPGVAVNQYAPASLNLKWAFKTEGPVTSSPAIVNGKVYIGSNDQHIYCLDAYTGKLIWKFKTNYRVTSSPAVAGGKVFTGFDDGYVYCLNATTGALIWKTINIYGGPPPEYLVEVASFQPRSSPLIVGDKLYVGALDGKIYCISTINGQILWTYQTGRPIFGSPAYANGKIYIASTDRKLYCLDANTGTLVWTWTTPKTREGTTHQLFFVNTPTVADGIVFIGGGARGAQPIILVALNATTGSPIWITNMDPASNLQNLGAPTYVKGVLYVGDHMGVAAYNATNGQRIWYQWLGFQVFSSVAYADYPLGPRIYVGCDSYSITALDARTGRVLSTYTTGAQVVSSPAIYDGMVIVGSGDHHVYCFSDAPTYCPTIVAWCDWREAYVGENIIVHSRLLPGLPGEKLILTLTKPDGTQVHVNATTDQKGWVHFSFTVDTAGPWTWTVWYEGKDKGYIRYAYSYTDTHSLTVKSAITQQQAAAGPAIPTEYIVAIILAAIIIIAIAIYIIKRRR